MSVISATILYGNLSTGLSMKKNKHIRIVSVTTAKGTSVDKRHASEQNQRLKQCDDQRSARLLHSYNATAKVMLLLSKVWLLGTTELTTWCCSNRLPSVADNTQIYTRKLGSCHQLRQEEVGSSSCRGPKFFPVYLLRSETIGKYLVGV